MTSRANNVIKNVSRNSIGLHKTNTIGDSAELRSLRKVAINTSNRKNNESKVSLTDPINETMTENQTKEYQTNNGNNKDLLPRVSRKLSSGMPTTTNSPNLKASTKRRQNNSCQSNVKVVVRFRPLNRMEQVFSKG